MRAAIALALSLALLCACAPKPDSHRIVATWPRAEAERNVPQPPASARVEPAQDEDLPAADPKYSEFDAMGRTPDQVLTELIEFGNEGDWKSAYALYASPEVDRETFTRERIRAHEVYVDFTVNEVRVIDEVDAIVRVSYMIPPVGTSASVTVEPPGEWWALTMVEGVWKVNWLPRQ
jgi:hypothetical protein